MGCAILLLCKLVAISVTDHNVCMSVTGEGLFQSFLKNN
jgi:hypothetical protein